MSIEQRFAALVIYRLVDGKKAEENFWGGMIALNLFCAFFLLAANERTGLDTTDEPKLIITEGTLPHMTTDELVRLTKDAVNELAGRNKKNGHRIRLGVPPDNGQAKFKEYFVDGAKEINGICVVFSEGIFEKYEP